MHKWHYCNKAEKLYDESGYELEPETGIGFTKAQLKSYLSKEAADRAKYLKAHPEKEIDIIKGEIKDREEQIALLPKENQHRKEMEAANQKRKIRLAVLLENSESKKYLLPFGHLTSDEKLYRKSLKAFPTDSLFGKEEYEKWLNKQ